jgi:hypothetical protein
LLLTPDLDLSRDPHQPRKQDGKLILRLPSYSPISRRAERWSRANAIVCRCADRERRRRRKVANSIVRGGTRRMAKAIIRVRRAFRALRGPAGAATMPERQRMQGWLVVDQRATARRLEEDAVSPP